MTVEKTNQINKFLSLYNELKNVKMYVSICRMTHTRHVEPITRYDRK